jgi:hypothetical protein
MNLFRAYAWVASLALVLVIAACGTTPQDVTPDPDPEPDPLAITGVTPDVALPGEEVVISGTGFEDEFEVTVGGVAGRVTDRSDTELTVVVPSVYGYPVITVDEESAERLLFVGVDYDGPETLADVQNALDDLPEEAALRIGAGTYVGVSLDVDNRKLFGAGSTTVLEATGDVTLYARSTHVTVLEGVVVDAADLDVRRGRLSTLAHGDGHPVSGTVVIQDVTMDVAGFTITNADYLRLELLRVDVTADYVDTNGGQNVAVDIRDSTFEVAGDADFDHYGSLAVYDSSFDVGGRFYVYIDYLSGFTLVGVDVTANDVYMYAYDAVSPFEFIIDDVTFTSATSIYVGSDVAYLAITGSTFTAATYIEIEGDDDGVHVSIVDSALTAGTWLELDADNYGATLTVIGSTVTAGTWMDVDTLGSFRLDASTLSAGDSLYMDFYGEVWITDSTLTSETGYVDIYTDYGSIRVHDTDVSAGTYLELDTYGVVEVLGGSLDATTTLYLQSRYAGDIVVDGVTISAADLVLQDGGNQYAGANGIVRIVNNPAIVIADELFVAVDYSDVRIEGNTLIQAFILDVYAFESDIAFRDNAMIQVANNGGTAAYVWAEFGAIEFTGNTVEVVGVFTLNAPAGKLTMADNDIDAGGEDYPNN